MTRGRGRPPGIQLDPDQEGYPTTQVGGAEVDSGGRISIPQPLGHAVGWLKFGSSQYVLASLREISIVALFPWDSAGEKVVARKRELERQIESEPSALLALQQLIRWYRRIPIAAKFRMSLPSDVLLHLGIGTLPSRIYVVQTSDRLELISKESLESSLGEQHDALNDLP